MAPETHFIQCCDGPVFVGPGAGALLCNCGNSLIEGYDPARFRAVGIQCGQCGALTMTPPLPEATPPPFAVVIAEPVAEARLHTMTLPAHAFVVGRAEMDRITALYQPVTPASNVYQLTPELLDAVEAAHERHLGSRLPTLPQDRVKSFAGIRDHALGWAAGHLRYRMAGSGWSCVDRAETSAAAVQVTGFLHFEATWSHHPLFPAMAATAAERGFSAHGLAPFAAAHCLTMMRNRISFPTPTGYPGRIDGFSLATGPTDVVGVRTEVFDRFEHPFGAPWDAAALRNEVAERIAAEQGRINLKNPGMLLLSPGTALSGFDEALIEAIKATLPTLGRKNRGLMAVAPIVLRMQAIPDPHALRFGYGLFPIANRYYQGDSVLQMAGTATV